MPRGPKKDPNRPRGRMSAYAFFLQDEREALRRADPNKAVIFNDFTRQCAVKWRTISDQLKNRYLRMAKQDKLRYDNDMKSYSPPAGSNKKQKRKRKDPNAPKRPLSAFFIFSKDKRPNLNIQHPEWRVGQIAKALSQRWHDAPEKVKNKYIKLSTADKARYKKQMSAWHSSQK